MCVGGPTCECPAYELEAGSQYAGAGYDDPAYAYEPGCKGRPTYEGGEMYVKPGYKGAPEYVPGRLENDGAWYVG